MLVFHEHFRLDKHIFNTKKLLKVVCLRNEPVLLRLLKFKRPELRNNKKIEISAEISMNPPQTNLSKHQGTENEALFDNQSV